MRSSKAILRGVVWLEQPAGGGHVGATVCLPLTGQGLRDRAAPDHQAVRGVTETLREE